MYADLMDTIGFVSKYDPEVGAAKNLPASREIWN